MFTFVHIAAVFVNILRFLFLLLEVNYFGFDGLLHSSLRERISSFSRLIIIINNMENADAEML